MEGKVKCEGVLVRKGTPCQHPALDGERFCGQHEPNRRAKMAAKHTAANMKRHGYRPTKPE